MIETPVAALSSHASRSESPSGSPPPPYALLTPPSGQHPPTPAIECRRLRPRDLRFLVSNVNVTYLDQPHSFTDRSGSLMTAIQGLRPMHRLAPITNVALSEQDQFLGFVQFHQFPPDRRWVASGIGIADGNFESDRIIEQLLEYSIRKAGSRGVKRLFARIPEGSALSVPFRSTGYEPYMSEEIYQMVGKPKTASRSERVREQEASDTWAVHQLYHASVPRTVQFSEAWTSHRWDISTPKRTAQPRRSYVVEDGHQVIAHARVQVGNRTAVLDVMYLAERRDCVAEFCYDVVGRLADAAGINRVFVTVRANQAELETAVLDLGMEHISRQELLVRYTAAKVSMKVVENAFPTSQEVLERVPKRVPTYLNRPVGEESMT